MSEPKLLKLPLDAIRWDPDVMPRIGSDSEVVKEYAEEMRLGAEFPPSVVFFDGEKNWGADGKHRADAAKACGAGRVLCEVRRGTRDDAIWFAAGVNLRHGLRPTNADKRLAVRNCLAVPAIRKKTDAVIAEQCGVSGRFVGSIRKQIETAEKESQEAATATDERPATRTVTRTKGGQTQRYEMRVGGDRKSKARQAAEQRNVTKDGLNVPIVTWCRPVFERSLDIDELCTRIGGICKEIETLAGDRAASAPRSTCPSWQKRFSS